MKRLITILAAAALAACSGSKSSSSGSTAGSSTGTTTSGGSTGTSGSSGTTGGTTGVTTGGTTGVTTSGTGSSGSSGASTSTSSSGGSTGGPPPANDTCTAATALTPGAPGDTQTVTGDTTNATDDFQSSGCGGYGGDVFYTLHLTAESKVTAAMTPSDSTKTGVVSILQSCSATQELVCDSTSGTATAVANDLQAGDYIVVADNYSGDEGPFSLTVTLSAPVPPPPGDVCSAAIALTAHAPGDTQTVTGDTTGAANDFTSNCGGSGGDLFYALTLTADAQVTAAITPADSAKTGVVSIIPACGTNNDLVCGSSSGTTAGTATKSFLAAGTYYIVADNFGGDNGPFSLTVTLAAPVPPPAGDTCETLPSGSSSQDIALSAIGDGGYTASVQFDTTLYANDTKSATTGPCSGYGTGHDEVFRVAVPSPVSSLTATVTPYGDAGSFQPVVYIRSSPCSDVGFTDGGPGSELACDAPFSNTTATATATTVPAGTYYVWVDGTSSSYGPGTLTVSVP